MAKNNSMQAKRYTVEYLEKKYSKTQLLKIVRFSLVNDIQVLSKRDMDRIVQLPDTSPELDYWYRLPKGVKAPLGKKYFTTDFDCKCEGLCNITEISKILVRALHVITLKFKHPIKVVRGYECSNHGSTDHDIQHTRGNALTLQSSDNDRLYKTINKTFPHYALGICDHYVYLNLSTLKDNHGNVAPVGPRWDYRSNLSQ